jgi:hypothetical protein
MGKNQFGEESIMRIIDLSLSWSRLWEPIWGNRLWEPIWGNELWEESIWGRINCNFGDEINEKNQYTILIWGRWESGCLFCEDKLINKNVFFLLCCFFLLSIFFVKSFSFFLLNLFFFWQILLNLFKISQNKKTVFYK